MAQTRTTISGRVVNCSAPCNAVPATSQDSSAVANNPVLDKIVTPSANLGVCYTNADKASERVCYTNADKASERVCYTNADKASEQSEAQKTDSSQHGVDMAETSRLVKEDVPSQPTNFSTTNVSSSSSTLPNNQPSSDLQAMFKFMMEQQERESKAREEKEEKDRQERERVRKEERQDRLDKEERNRKEREERWRREDQERERKHNEFMERAMDEYEKQMKRRNYLERIEKENHEFLIERMKNISGRKNTEKKTVMTLTSENKAEPEIKTEKSNVSEKASELESFQTDVDPKDSPWDGPQDNVLVRDMAIDSAENMANECAENVCCEAMDAFTSLDDSLDSNLTLVGGKRSTPEPERRLDATMSENPSASDPSWIFKSPESGEKSGNPDFESHIIEAQLCDDFLRYSFPMVFSAKNRTVTVTKVGVVQYLGENSTSFSAIQCSIPYNDNCYGFDYDSVRSVSSCGSSREQKSGSVWSISLSDANKTPRTVRSENLRRKAGNQYYPISKAAQWSMKLKLAKRTLKFTPMVWSLVLSCSTDIAIGVYRSRVAMFPEYLTQPPGCQRVVIWSFKLEFGIT